MPTRREFLGAMAAPIVGTSTTLNASAAGVASLLQGLASDSAPPEEVAQNEDFWFEVQRAFTVDRSLINLNNGGVSPAPRWVQATHKRHLDFSHRAPAYTMWKILEPQRESVRQRLARHWGVDPEEVALTRNASESLQTCQLGLDLAPGDEVLTTTQDYPRMITTFKQRERRDGIKLVQCKIPTPCEDMAEIVRRFERHITPRTKLILMCHMINLTGQVLPVRDVVRAARKRGIPVIVDGAHALAHIDFEIADLDCDYYASSLHKWLFAPHGTGLLYVRRDKIAGLWPLMAAPEKQDSDIRKFEEIGTHPAAGYLAIAEALTFHQGIGGKRKEARMIHLRNYWAERLLQNDRFSMNTSLKPGFAGGLANVRIRDIDLEKLTEWLFKEHRIIVTRIEHDELAGLRVSPSIYTTLEELDRFCEAMELVAKNGLPA